MESPDPTLPEQSSVDLSGPAANPPSPEVLAFRDAFTANAPLPTPVAVVETPRAAPEPARLSTLGRTLWNWVLPFSFFTSIILLVLYAAPYLVMHWRLAEAHTDAEAVYLKRRAELKAEAEHAEQQLDVLDKRVHMVSLGFREVIRKVAPKVVNVLNLSEPKKNDVFKKKTLIYDPQTDRKYIQMGVGSGILVRPGYLLTNYHVVRQAERLRITFASGQSIGADPGDVFADAITDLAVIRLPNPPPAHLKDDLNVVTEFADSDKDVHVGDWALAIGSPLGLKQTVTQGVVSAKGRLLNLLDLVELLQTDAAINPGNSGGPLFDQMGRVMGINVAIASDNGGNQGIGFAIPSNVAKKIFEQLVQQGEVARGYLGIGLEEVVGARAKEMGIADQGGVLVAQVLANQAAAKAGLKVGDIIVRFNKEVLERHYPVRHLRQLIVDTDPGATIALEILRDGETHTIQVQVGKRPAILP